MSTAQWVPALVLGALAILYALRRIRLPNLNLTRDIMFGRPSELPAADFNAPNLSYYYRVMAEPLGATVTPEEERSLEDEWSAPDWAELIAGIERGADHPTAVARDGLHSFTRLLDTGDERFLQRCVAAADWLVEHQGEHGEFRYGFSWKGQPPGWVSGLGQGAAISTVARAYQETGEAKYLRSAREALGFMLTPTEDGGTLGQFEDGSPIVEEYPGLPTLNPHVLNGAISAYFGIHDLARVTGAREIQLRLEELLSSLKRNLWRYRAEPRSRYNTLEDSRASLSYHRMHVEQLRALARITGDSYFAEFADEFARQVEAPSRRLRMLLSSIRVPGSDSAFVGVLLISAVASLAWASHAWFAAPAVVTPGATREAHAYWLGALITLVGVTAAMGRTGIAIRFRILTRGVTSRLVLFVGGLLAAIGSLMPLVA